MTCAAPIPFETLVAYWAGDLGARESDEVEEHLFGCAACTDASARVSAVTEQIRALVPTVIPGAMVALLRARGLRVDENPVQPGVRSRIVFTTQDLVIHRLQGLDLDDAEKVSVSVRVEETDDVLADVPEAPFERASGEVLIACQRHFAAFPPNTRFVVRTKTRSGAERVANYVVEHDMRLA